MAYFYIWIIPHNLCSQGINIINLYIIVATPLIEYILPESWRGFGPTLLHIYCWDIVPRQKFHISFYIVVKNREVGIIVISYDTFHPCCFQCHILCVNISHWQPTRASWFNGHLLSDSMWFVIQQKVEERLISLFQNWYDGLGRTDNLYISWDSISDLTTVIFPKSVSFREDHILIIFWIFSKQDTYHDTGLLIGLLLVK